MSKQQQSKTPSIDKLEQSKAALIRAKDIILEVFEEFDNKSTEFCLQMAEDRAQIEELGVSIYDALPLLESEESNNTY
jgi:hypothetical protein